MDAEHWELSVLRHGHAEPESDSGQDVDRRLTLRGQRQVASVAERLAALGWWPDLVISSPAQRARQTTNAIIESVGIRVDQVSWIGEIYSADGRFLADLIGRVATASHRVLLVGHNPGLEQLINHFMGGYYFMAPAALFRMRFEVPWEAAVAGSATCLGVEQPDSP